MAGVLQRAQLLRGQQFIIRRQFQVGSGDPVTVTLPVSWSAPEGAACVTIKVLRLIVIGEVPEPVQHKYLLLESMFADTSTLLLATADFNRAQLTPLVAAFWLEGAGDVKLTEPSAGLIRPAPPVVHELHLFLKEFTSTGGQPTTLPSLDIILHLQIY